MKVKFSMFISLTLSLLFLSNIYAQDDSYVVNKETLNVRKNADITSQILGTLKKGAVVSIINSDDINWSLISYYGTEGYVYTKYLVSIEKYNQYKDWKKLNIETGDTYNCENIQPEYDNSINNRLVINVGNNSDAVVKLMNRTTDICNRIVYIKSGDSYTMRNIPLGNYYLKIAYGKDYRESVENNRCKIKFFRNPIYKKGEDVLEFEKIQTANTFKEGKEYKNWHIASFELSLNIVFAGG